MSPRPLKRDNKFVAAAAGLVLLVSGATTGWRLSGGFGPTLDQAPYQAVGRALARQALKLLQPGGTITVITRDTVMFQNPATDVVLTSFQAELARAHAQVGSVEALQIDPLQAAVVPSGDFVQWIKKASKGSVIVSFMGPPVLSEAELKSLGEIKPAIVALCSGPVAEQVDLRSLFSRGLLQAAVVSKRAGLCKPARTSNEREVFDSRFVEVTSGNLAALSSVSNVSR